MRLTKDPFQISIRRRRQSMGLTLEQLAERSGLTPNMIGCLENGKRSLSLLNLIAVASALGVSAADLWKFEDLTPAAEAGWLFQNTRPLRDGPPYRAASACRGGAQFEVPFRRLENKYEIVSRKKR